MWKQKKMSRYADAWQLDTNPMKQGMMNPMAVLGEIPSKGSLDWSLVEEFQTNADDPNIAGECYPNGNKPICHDLMPGDPLFALKCVRNPESITGAPNEMVIAGVAGLHWGAYSDEDELTSQFYFVGICKTEYRVSSPNDNGRTKDPEHGFGILKVGTHSTSNNGPYMLYPGTKIRWRAPVSAISSEQPPVDSIAHQKGEKLNRFARGGTPNLQWRFEIVPFDHTDVSINYLRAFHMMKHTESDRGKGIADVPFYRHFVRDQVGSLGLSCAQESAGGHFYHVAGIVAGALERLVAIDAITIKPLAGIDNTKVVTQAHASDVSELIEKLGVWETSIAKREPFVQLWENIFFNDLNITSSAIAKNYETTATLKPRKDALRINESKDRDLLYARLRFSQSKFQSAHLFGDWNHNTSSIMGVVLNYAAPGDLAHVMWGHFVL